MEFLTSLIRERERERERERGRKREREEKRGYKVMPTFENFPLWQHGGKGTKKLEKCKMANADYSFHFFCPTIIKGNFKVSFKLIFKQITGKCVTGNWNKRIE